MGISILISDDQIDSGYNASVCVADLLNDAIADKGSARMIISADPDQFDLLDSLLVEDVDWSKVEIFQLCEYVLPASHPDLLKNKLDDLFISKVEPLITHYISEDTVDKISKVLSEDEIDVAVIGIGKNCEIGFNYAKADFKSTKSYEVTELRDTPSFDAKKGITMLPLQIMKARHLVSVVSGKVKKDAVHKTITEKYSENIPSSILKLHQSWFLFLDSDSSEKLLNLETQEIFLKEN